MVVGFLDLSFVLFFDVELPFKILGLNLLRWILAKINEIKPLTKKLPDYYADTKC